MWRPITQAQYQALRAEYQRRTPDPDDAGDRLTGTGARSAPVLVETLVTLGGQRLLLVADNLSGAPGALLFKLVREYSIEEGYGALAFYTMLAEPATLDPEPIVAAQIANLMEAHSDRPYPGD